MIDFGALFVAALGGAFVFGIVVLFGWPKGYRAYGTHGKPTPPFVAPQTYWPPVTRTRKRT